MIKNYVLELGGLFKSAGIFMEKNFKKYMLVIWLLIFLQLALGIPCLYVIKQYSEFSTLLTVVLGLGFLVYLVLLFLMFKKVFELASSGLEKEKPSNFKVFKSLLAFALFNCVPPVVLMVCYYIAQYIPNSALFFIIGLNIFTVIYYVALSLSISAVCEWEDKPVVVAIAKSLKLFFQKIKYTLPLFLVIFLLGTLVSYLFSTSLYAILIKFGFLNQNLANVIHAMMNVYSLYIFAGFYVGVQVAVIKEARN